MGKKTKQIEKETKEDKPKSTGKKAKDATPEWDIFSDGFKDRLNQFISLNKEVLDLKASVEGTDQTEQINERKAGMAKKVEEAAAAILQDELSSLEEWIKEQQLKLKEEITKIEEAYENSRKTLISTGFFSEEEVKGQLISVQKKCDEKKEVYENYDSLLARSKDIYN